MPDTLATLRRLRQLAASQSRRELASHLAAERHAEQRLAAAHGDLQTEAAAAPLDAAHPLAHAYAAWRPAGLAILQKAAADVRTATETVAIGREALAAARAAERAVEQLQDDRAAQCRIDAVRKEQR